MLQRNGEALAIVKQVDRFTVRLHSGQAVEDLVKQLGIEPARSISTLNCLEFQVHPDQLEAAMVAARQWGSAVFVSHVYQMQRSPGIAIYLSNQITIQFAESVEAGTMRSIAAEYGLQVLKLIPGISKAFVFEVTEGAIENPIKLTNRLLELAEVLMAEPNIAVQRQGFSSTPTYEGQSSQQSIQLEAVWSITQGMRSTVIAMAGDLIDLSHPVLQGLGKIVAPVGLGQNSEPDQPTSSPVLAVMQTAPECALMPIALGEFVDDQAVEQVFEWGVEQGASVICCDWGICATYFPLSLRQQAAITRAATQGRGGKGCVVIFAAGNENQPIDGVIPAQAEDSELERTNWLNGFAVHPDVITVATSPHQASNWGESISVCANAVNTGEASAVVAGVAALMLSANPNLTAREVRQILQDTADRVLEAQPDPELGLSYGSYDGRGHSQWFGYGRVNADKAVQVAFQKMQTVGVPIHWIEQQVTEPVDIPDGDQQGIMTAIEVTATELVQDIQVMIDLEHRFMGDLEIYLIPPQGERILLQSRSLGRLSLLRKTYSIETTPLLQNCCHRSAAGRWQLKLIDYVPQHTGRLKRWELRLGV